MRDIISAYHQCVAEIVTRFDGFVARYMGDGVLAYFGYPKAHEDDPEQAVRAGLALVEAVASDPREPKQVRVGIATGLTVVGDLIGSGSSQEHSVVGDTPNLAARLQTLAEPGAVFICQSTRRLVAGHFDCRDLGTFALKGIAAPVLVYQVLRTSDVESRFEAAHKTKPPSLFGREEEMELLLRQWRQARQAEGQVVMLIGDAGIGKSNIALALDQRLKGEPHTTLRYFCSAHHTNSALYPFIGQLRRAARFEHDDTPAMKLSKLDLLVAQSNGDPEHLAVLADLLALPMGDGHRLRELSPQERKDRTFATLSAQLSGLATHQPVLIIFEDVHWIDPTSLELLTATVKQVAQCRAMLLVTGRAEFTSPWPNCPHVTTIPLTHLKPPFTARLVEWVAEGRMLPKELIDEILARTDGVPLFIEELTKTVLESELLRERDGRYVLDGPLQSSTIPTTLQASLMARLDRFTAAREAAQIGAVAGRDFHFELLNAVAGLPKERLEQALEQLERSELVSRRGEIPHAIYTFKHMLVRDAAYASLLKSRRAQLHAAIANALEEQYPEIVQTQPETLARHLTDAGLSERAIGYWLQAGKNAALRSANIEAIAHLQYGLELTQRLPASSGKDKAELGLQLLLGPCLVATHGPAASNALATFARARDLCKRLGQPPEYLQVMFWLATASVVRGELPQALEAIAGLPNAAEARGNQPALLNGIRGQGMILMFMGRITEARAALERAIEVFSVSHDADRIAARTAGQDAGVSSLVLLAWVYWILGRVDEAVSRMAAALERADAVQHAHTQAYAWYYASVLHALRGEQAIAQGYAERCLALSEQQGFRHWLGLSRALRGICLALLNGSGGRLDEVTVALDAYQRGGYQLGLTVQFVLLCPVLLLRNEPDAALEVIDHGLSIVSHNSERFFEAELYRLKACALLMRGAAGAADIEAEALLKQALQTARSQQTRSLELRAATDLARLWMSQGKRNEALDVLSSIYAWFTEGFDTRDLKDAKKVLAQISHSA